MSLCELEKQVNSFSFFFFYGSFFNALLTFSFYLFEVGSQRHICWSFSGVFNYTTSPRCIDTPSPPILEVFKNKASIKTIKFKSTKTPVSLSCFPQLVAQNLNHKRIYLLLKSYILRCGIYYMIKWLYSLLILQTSFWS